jgi:hypothetical protein
VLDWAFSPRGDPILGIVLTAAYAPVWMQLSLVVECRERIGRALDSEQSRPATPISATFELMLMTEPPPTLISSGMPNRQLRNVPWR